MEGSELQVDNVDMGNLEMEMVGSEFHDKKNDGTMNESKDKREMKNQKKNPNVSVMVNVKVIVNAKIAVKGRTNMDKWRYTLITTLLFFIVINPYTYKLVHFLLKKVVKIADKSGCPSVVGMIIHGIVFTLLLRGLMELNI